MYYNSIFSQLLHFIPRYRFTKIVEKFGVLIEKVSGQAERNYPST